MNKFFSDLQKRGLIYQVTDESLYAHDEKLNFYCGFDPTSDSLHLGSLLPLLTMRRFQKEGHKPILLLGGGTGMIGDPSGKSQARTLLSIDALSKNLAGIKKVASQFLSFEGPHSAIFVNNLDWLNSFSLLDFLRDVGKHYTINSMLAKDSVRARFEDRDQGISFTEFSYMLLQGFDFYHLHKVHQCQLQLGGSDQWGNVTAGTDLIRKKFFQEGLPASKAFGLTMPLVTKSDGQKFGKSESGTIWLTKEKNSSFEMYQFLVRTADQDIEKYLKFFSFRSLDEIDQIMKSHLAQPEKRLAQNALATELVQLIHGEAELSNAQKATESLFSGDVKDLSADQFALAFGSASSITSAKSRLKEKLLLIDLLVEARICTSKGNARKEIHGGGISVNGKKIPSVNKDITADELLSGDRLVLQKGKKTYVLIEFKS